MKKWFSYFLLQKTSEWNTLWQCPNTLISNHSTGSKLKKIIFCKINSICLLIKNVLSLHLMKDSENMSTLQVLK
jgi:hypothetical protein